MADHPKCIDISHWQGFPDFKKVKAAGVIAMIHKATEGTGYTDPNFRANCKAAVDAGIKVCAYHWIKPGDNAAAQMAHFLKTADPTPSGRVVIDYEENGCTLDQLKVAVQTLLEDPRGLHVTVYSGHLLKQQLGTRRDAFLAEHTDLWLAQYTTGKPSWPTATYPSWMLWQYSEKGQVDGITGSAVDLDRFNGDDAALLEWIVPGSKAAVPVEPKSEAIPVTIAMTIPDDVALEISVNGEVVHKSP